mmetsp:Transcript_29749/g.47883  ORF Transcript_29749/g.47883 Transcript_29749/m.47883 type:complete len:228 (-) Transcript_29749:683-1366(-)
MEVIRAVEGRHQLRRDVGHSAQRHRSAISFVRPQPLKVGSESADVGVDARGLVCGHARRLERFCSTVEAADKPDHFLPPLTFGLHHLLHLRAPARSVYVTHAASARHEKKLLHAVYNSMHQQLHLLSVLVIQRQQPLSFHSCPPFIFANAIFASAVPASRPRPVPASVRTVNVGQERPELVEAKNSAFATLEGIGYRIGDGKDQHDRDCYPRQIRRGLRSKVVIQQH